MNLLELQIDDLNLYFAGTFVKLTLTPQEEQEWREKNRWIYIKKIITDPTELRPKLCYNQNDAFGDRWIILRREGMMDCRLPYTGHFNFNSSSVHIFRTNKRQNKKGLYDGNCHHKSFLSNFIVPKIFPPTFIQRNTFSLCSQYLNQIFNSRYPPIEVAFNSIKSKRFFSRAISPDLLLSVGLKDYHPALWLGKSYVGRMMSPKEVVIELPLLYEDVHEKLKPFDVSLRMFK